jgi:hypothetical protein
VEPYGRQAYNLTAGASTITVQAIANDTVDFYFPKGYIDLKTLSMFFDYFCLPYTTAISGTAQALPRDTECMIDQLEIYLGGKKINHISHYNQIFYILSTYAMGAEHFANRNTYQNNWTNGRTSLSPSLQGTTFCCKKWLGLLGKDLVLDTNVLGQLHIRITLAHPQITTSNNAAHSWGVNNLYMTVKYYENYTGDLPKYIEFDDYKSILLQHPNHNATSTLIVNSSRIDWAIGRTIRNDIFTKVAVIPTEFSSVVYFTSAAGGPTNWNILVNNNPLYRYDADMKDALFSMYELFPDGCINPGQTNTTVSRTLERSWACGSKLGFQSEMPEQVEFTLTCKGTASLGCFSIFMVKTLPTLEITKDGQIIHKV